VNDDAIQQRRARLAVALLLVGITAGHYLIGTERVLHHDILRRLYYIPVCWGALQWGLRGGLVVSLATILLYLPHAFLIPGHRDPASAVDKAAELLMYLVIGAIAGTLVDRQRATAVEAASEAIERSRAEERAARSASVAHLARGIAHEIRNPLGGIQGAIEILAGAVPTDSPAAEMADVGVREIERLDRVIAQFMAFARPAAARLGNVDVGKSIAHVVALMQPPAMSADVELGQTPCAASESGESRPGNPLWAHGDPDHVTQILTNLVTNAIAAAPGGRVEVGAHRQPDGSVMLHVSDDGGGVDPALGASIYDPYVTSTDGGTGLGLAIAASLAAGLGGRLHHTARASGGTVFHLELPGGRLDG